LNKKKIWVLGIIAVPILFAFSGWGAYEYHETPQFCGNTCHMMQPYVDTLETGGKMAAKHAEAGVSCLDCHEPTIEEQMRELKVYVTGEYKNPLKKRKFENDWCFRCHEHDTYEMVKETTADWVEEVNRNPHDSPHFHNLECYMCHQSHRDSAIYCSECHLMPHLGEGWEVPNIPENPIP